jgi:hypothetical protein
MKPFNWAGVIAAIVVAEALGFLWYGPLFGERWAMLMGRPGEEVISSGNTDMAFGVIATAIWVCGLAWLSSRIGSIGWGAGARLGGATWLFFAMPMQSFAFTYAGHNDKLIPIDMGYTLAAFVLAGALVSGLSFGGSPGASTAA